MNLFCFKGYRLCRLYLLPSPIKGKGDLSLDIKRLLFTYYFNHFIALCISQNKNFKIRSKAGSVCDFWGPCYSYKILQNRSPPPLFSRGGGGIIRLRGCLALGYCPDYYFLFFGLPKESIFLTTFYGLYKIVHNFALLLWLPQ